jgi:hypothetical protein
VHQVWLDGGVQEGANSLARVRRVGAEVEVCIAQCLADGVDTVVVARRQQRSLSFQVGEANRVGSRPGCTEAALGEQVLRRENGLVVGLLRRGVAILLCEGRLGIAAHRVCAHICGLVRRVRQGTLRLETTNLVGLSGTTLGGRIRVNNGNQNNKSKQNGSEANHCLLRELHLNLYSFGDKNNAECHQDNEGGGRVF